MSPCDVTVIGAGPAGCATALFLAQAGWSVEVLDQARFPRDKVCGEFISPAADPLLEQLGVLARLEAVPPVRLKGVAFSAYGGPELLIPYPPWPGGPEPVTSLSLPRLTFDRILTERLSEAGVRLKEGFKVTALNVHQGRVTGVQGFDAERTPFKQPARLVIDAGGRQAVSVRQFQARRREGRGRKIALAAHWQNAAVPEAYCYMHISPPGYTGLSPVPGGLCNLVLVLDQAAVGTSDREALYRRVVRSNPRRRAFLEQAEPVEPVRSVDSLAFGVAPPPVDGLMRVGDAMGFIDPFTGEGIFLALRSAQLAAGVAGEALHQGDLSRRRLLVYEQRREEEFRKKFLLSRILQFLIYNQPLCRGVAGLLAERPDLARTLVGVIGDYLPAGRVVGWRYLAQCLGEIPRLGWGRAWPIQKGQPGLKS